MSLPGATHYRHCEEPKATKQTRRSAYYHGLPRSARNDGVFNVIARSQRRRSKPDAVLTMGCFAYTQASQATHHGLLRSARNDGVFNVIARSQRRRSNPDAVLTMGCFAPLAMTEGRGIARSQRRRSKPDAVLTMDYLR